MSSPSAAFFERARAALGTSQVGLGQMLGAARRTAQRWSSSGVPAYHLPKLASIVYPHDPDLAQEIAHAAGSTLEKLGIALPPPPPPPPPAPVMPPDAIVDALVCAAAEAMNVMPRDVRPGLLAAFTRAGEIGASIELVTRVLRDKVQTR